MTSIAPRRGRIALLATIALLTTLFAAVPDASAHGTKLRGGRATGPTPVSGRAWSVPVIRLYDTTPRLYREGIDIAIREWNMARIGIRFARTPRRNRAHVVVSTARYPGGIAGMATLGMARGAWVRLDTSLIATEPEQRGNVVYDFAGGAVPEQIAEVMAHELGHVLGLEHTGGCSLMGPMGPAGCGLRPPEGKAVCRMIQRRDLVAMARRYGGRGVVRRDAYCAPSATRSGRVGAVKAAPSTREYATVLTWRGTTNTYGYAVERSTPNGPCPTHPGATSDRGSANYHREYWEYEKVAARYCYSVWSRNGRGTLTGPTRVFVDVKPPVAAPVTNLQATVAGSTVQLSWTNPPGTRVLRIHRTNRPVAGTCDLADFWHASSVAAPAATASLADAQSGTWTYAVTRSDDPDDDVDDYASSWASAPTCVTVTVP